MKTLFVFNHPAPYKVETFNGLANKIDLEVLFERIKAKDRPDTFYENNVYNFKHSFLKRGSFSKENSNTNELRKYIKNNYKKFDVIVMNGYSTLTEQRAIRYMIKHDIPYLLQINGGVIKKDSPLKKKIKTYYISHAFRYLSPCLEADKYLLYYGAKQENIYHYPYSNYHNNDVLNTVPSKEDKDELRNKYNIPNGKVFISAAQFIERKNNFQLFDVFKDVNATLILVGSGEQKDLYINYLKDNQIKNVEIRDYMPKENLFEMFQACDFFITLSKQDIFGHTTLEAMANGLPVISSDKVVSSLDVIKNNFNGFIVSLDNNQNIVHAINSVDSNMSINALATARENTFEKSIEKIVETLEVNK